ncbi:MAG: hypothetical protein FWF01_02775 [Alphaproteobacteria bacterium]|nr:hypothetical protein [Alphaproteobacteria bacterium]
MRKAAAILVLMGLLWGCDSGQVAVDAVKNAFILPNQYRTVLRALSDNPYLHIEKWERRKDVVAVTMRFNVKEALDSRQIRARFEELHLPPHVYGYTLERIKSFVVTLEYGPPPDPASNTANFLGGWFQVRYTDFFNREHSLPPMWDNQIGIEDLRQIYEGDVPAFFMGVVGLVAEAGVP